MNYEWRRVEGYLTRKIIQILKSMYHDFPSSIQGLASQTIVKQHDSVIFHSLKRNDEYKHIGQIHQTWKCLELDLKWTSSGPEN